MGSVLSAIQVNVSQVQVLAHEVGVGEMQSSERRYSLVQCVLLRLLQRTGNQDSDDQTVDGNDTRHDDGDDGLHDQLGSHHRHGGNTGTGLGRSIGSSEG